MKQKVVAKQPNSRMCFVCGMKNPIGLKASFYNLENGEVAGVFRADEEHQGYPDTLHGCITVGLLEEAIGRAIRTRYDQEVLGATVEFHVRYKAQIPLHQPLRIIARVTRDARKIYEGSAELKLADGTVAAQADGKFFRLSGERVSEEQIQEAEWKVYPAADDPVELEI